MNPTVLVAVFGADPAELRSVADRLAQAGWSVLPLGPTAADAGGDQLKAAGRHAEQQGCTSVVTLDLDRGDDPAEIERLLAPARNDPATIVFGRRPREGGGPGWFWPRFCLRLASGVDGAAACSSFRVYPTAALTGIAWSGRGRVGPLELLARAAWAGVRVESVALPDLSDLPGQAQPDAASRPPGLEALPTCLRLCLRNLNPWPFRQSFHADPNAVPFSFRHLGAWWWSLHCRATRRLEADEVGLSLRHPIRSLKSLHLERTAPLELVLACMLGVFLGALPLLFVHTIAIVFYATRLRLNRAIAFYASNLCAPFLPPFVPALDIEVGHYLLHGRFLTLADLGTRDALFQTLCAEAHLRLLEYLIGSLVVGPLLALLVGGIVYTLATARRRNQTVNHG